jgi:tetratricopeptide (TPR) repeat protein
MTETISMHIELPDFMSLVEADARKQIIEEVEEKIKPHVAELFESKAREFIAQKMNLLPVESNKTAEMAELTESVDKMIGVKTALAEEILLLPEREALHKLRMSLATGEIDENTYRELQALLKPDKMPEKKRKKPEMDLAEVLDNVKNLVFEQKQFKEAARILEEAAELYPNSAPVQLFLGVTYSRIAGECKGEDAVRPWALKSGDAFKKAVVLASQYGGLNDEQLAKARESAELIERIKEAKTPSILENQHKEKYCASCGKRLLEPKPGAEPLRGIEYLDFADMVRYTGLELRRPGYVCRDCGATICRGCIPLRDLPKCPRCGSGNMKGIS